MAAVGQPGGGISGQPSRQQGPGANPQPGPAPSPPIVIPPAVKWFWIVISVLILASLIVNIVMFILYMKARATKYPYEQQFLSMKRRLVSALERPELHFKGPTEIAEVVESLPEIVQKENNDIYARKQKYRDLLKATTARKYNTWNLYRKNLYYFSKEAKNWYDAESFCISKDAHLASVQDEEEQYFIRSQLQQKSWIGLTVENDEGEWGWSDGSRLVTQYWSDGKPNNTQVSGRSSQNCAMMVPSLSSHNWNEESCYQLNSWVCKENRDHDEL